MGWDTRIEDAVGSRGLCLVIEDNPDIRDLIGLILTNAGFDVHSAEGGADGFRAAAVLQPVLITLDVGLPDMDGRDVAPDCPWSVRPRSS
ncbi:response regulator transcription factor [Paenarthrobacter aurescens]|uniref:response regulator transcription factor n=1 Tax=Paenarthrobacter aurescens TaxID=43663 RepID=UPI0035EC0697